MTINGLIHLISAFELHERALETLVEELCLTKGTTALLAMALLKDCLGHAKEIRQVALDLGLNNRMVPKELSMRICQDVGHHIKVQDLYKKDAWEAPLAISKLKECQHLLKRSRKTLSRYAASGAGKIRLEQPPPPRPLEPTIPPQPDGYLKEAMWQQVRQLHVLIAELPSDSPAATSWKTRAWALYDNMASILGNERGSLDRYTRGQQIRDRNGSSQPPPSDMFATTETFRGISQVGHRIGRNDMPQRCLGDVDHRERGYAEGVPQLRKAVLMSTAALIGHRDFEKTRL
ncbi:hypothetical protein VMCG_06692 [Cytospora schulzeri]|uniref:Uncharacterized protein n=1 Tax=Cytospora schulzeri TaxID=448051 RepID=A0A423W6U0_9PEZI|nr:hypothetical protein VMCG_06692 [Valsa malicola]